MPTKPQPKIFAWSYSRWQDYETCPLKAKLKHVDKMKEPGSPAMERGSMIHKLAEGFVNGTAKKLAPELVNFKTEFAQLKKAKAVVEQQWAFTDQWKPTGWFDWNAWCRVVVDAAVVVKNKLRIIDHKTGKVKEPGVLTPQLELYAMAGFKLMPKVTEVESELWFLDHGEEQKAVFKLADVPRLEKLWAERTRPMLNDRTFAPRPGNYCRWCHFRKANGGPCQY